MNKQEYTGLEVAIIGISMRVPGSNDYNEFWENIKNGKESIKFLTDDELNEIGVDEKIIKNKNFVRSIGGQIDDKEYFDAAFFGYTPEEAILMNPQTRIFHEETWKAIEDSGYDLTKYEGRIGLFAGASSSFSWEAMAEISAIKDENGTFSSVQLTNKDFLTTRVSHKLNMKGPSFPIQTACSTSLVAVHLAGRSLLLGECDMAIAGGVSISPIIPKGYLYQEGMILSKDGHCRPFDKNSSGTVIGNGIGVVVLKLLNKAIQDNDYIYAIIKGSAINNDGNRKTAYSAPSVKGQMEVIRSALNIAQIEARTIDYVECHGTATELGDLIEIDALNQAYSFAPPKECFIGSIKSNIGHLDAASGVVGLIKTVLCIKNSQFVPSINYENPNPLINIEKTPFRVITQLKKWKKNGSPKRAGISSFGIGGTNAHIIIEEPPKEKTNIIPKKSNHLMLISAKSETSLDGITNSLVNYLKNNENEELGKISYSLITGRTRFSYRRCFVLPEKSVRLKEFSFDQMEYKTFKNTDENPSIIFLFPGGGSQYINMAKDLYFSQKDFKIILDEGLEFLKELTGLDYKKYLFNDELTESNKVKIKDTEIALPLLFIVEYALARILMKWDIKPDAMIGHSLGEYVAACISGVFSYKDGIEIVLIRGRLMRKVEKGVMLSVSSSIGGIETLIDKDLSVAAINSPANCVIAGKNKNILDFKDKLEKLNIDTKLLHIDVASHSYLMDPILDEFRSLLKKIDLYSPTIPYISGLNGNWMNAEELYSDYWTKHLRNTVNFSEGVKKVLERFSNCIFVEVGPNNILSGLVKQQTDAGFEFKTVNLLRHPKEEVSDDYYLLDKIGELWLYGYELNWKEFFNNEKKIPVPTYVFDKQKYWIDDKLEDFSASNVGKLVKKVKIEDWFYTQCWKSSMSPVDIANISHNYIVIGNNSIFTKELIDEFHNVGNRTIEISVSNELKINKENKYEIERFDKSQYMKIFTQIGREKDVFKKIILLTDFDTPSDFSKNSIIKSSQNNGFYRLLNLIKALFELNFVSGIEIIVLTNSLHDILGYEKVNVDLSTILGPIKIVNQEIPFIKCRNIDIQIDNTFKENKSILKELIHEISSNSIEPIVALRNNKRWLPDYTIVDKKYLNIKKKVIRTNGVYLITGGLGRIGFTILEFLSEKYNANLIITGKTKLPDRNEWDNWIDEHGTSNIISRKLLKLKLLEENGSEVIYTAVDVCDTLAMIELVKQTNNNFGRIDGIIHSTAMLNPDYFQPISDIHEEMCEQHFHSKIYGLLSLYEAIKDVEYDFCCLMSSISTELGGLGFTGYASANIFMNYFAQEINKISDNRWISISWDGWEYKEDEMFGEIKNSTFLKMTIDESTKAFETILNSGLSGVIIQSLGDINIRINSWINLTHIEIEDEKKSNELFYARPSILTQFIAPVSENEKALAEIWQNFFKYDKIGTNDNFFELGGNSLKAISIINIIHKKRNIQIPIKDFFARATIAKLASYINHTNTKNYKKIPLAPIKDYYPLSSAQKRLYFLQQIDINDTTYNISNAFALKGTIELEQINNIFRYLISRHESLRTSFDIVKDELVQFIHKDVDFQVEEYLIKEAEINNVQKQFVRAFDLQKAPLLRVAFVKVENHDNLLMVDMHHIISDGLSYGILEKEFNDLRSGKELSPLPIQYKDYCEWINSPEQIIKIKEEEEYWIDKFKGEVPAMNLPLDFKRPAIKNSSGATISFVLDKKETTGIKQFANESDLTLYSVLLAVYTILLSKLCNQEDISVGTAMGGRIHNDLEGIVGMFVNTLVIRNKVENEMKLEDFVDQFKKTTLDAYENQHFQFEDLVERISVERDTSRNPIFDVAFNLLGQRRNSENVTLEKETGFVHIEGTSKFDLMLVAIDYGEKILLSFEYCTKIFKPETIDRFIEYYKQLINDIPISKGKKIYELNILPNLERDKILNEFNNNRLNYPSEMCIHHLFEEQVCKQPDCIAIVYNDKQISYSELNKRANQVAHFLLESYGLGESLIGIVYKPSIEIYISILGVLKAGMAYFPIDSSLPEFRIKNMLKDSCVNIILQHGNKYNYFDGDKTKYSINVLNIKHENENNIELPISSDSPAYLIYTSGSTGMPKGVLIKHRSLVNLTYGHRQHFNILPHDHFIKYNQFGFDASVWEIFTSLISGSTLYEIENDMKLDIIASNFFFDRNNITISFLPTQLCERFLEETNHSLRLLLTGGEKLNFYIKTNFKFYNYYGPTEDTVYTTRYEILEDCSNIPIGKATENKEIFILNRFYGVQPIGIAGELCIGGHGLALGYLNNPDLTSKKFIPHPFKDGELIYCTGDLARWLPDGNIEFLGRTDTQVKIRGFRIELYEIEKALLLHKSVIECYVDAVTNNENKYICAYLVSKNKLSSDELRIYLSELLPEYMIPSIFVFMDGLPLNNNGKIDKKALPTPNVNSETIYIAPISYKEKLLAEVWSKVLGIDNVGIQDNYFNLGGDSIKTIQIQARLRRLGYRIEIMDIFKYPTISELAVKLVPIDNEISQDIVIGMFEPTPIQRWFFEDEVDQHHFNQSVMLSSKERINVTDLGLVFRKLQEHHDALRIVVNKNNEKYFLYNNIPEESNFSIEVYDLISSVYPNVDLQSKANILQQSIDLFNGPLIKVGLFKMKDKDRILIIVHHLVIDGISWRIIFEDIHTLFSQINSNKQLELPLKSNSFKEWAECLANYSKNKELIAEKTYWSHIVEKKTNSIKREFEDTSWNELQIDNLSFTLDEDATQELLTNTNSVYNTEINDILLVGLGLAVKKIFGNDDIIISLEGHGRENIIPEMNISRTVGWFTSKYPVLIEMKSHENLSMQIRVVKENLRKIPNKGIGFGILKYLTPPDLKDDFFFDIEPSIEFNYLGQFDSDIRQMELFDVASESVGESVSPNKKYLPDFSLVGMLVSNKLVINIMFKKRYYSRKLVSDFMGQYKNSIIEVVSHCKNKTEKIKTPSDFTYKELSIESAEALSTQYKIQDIYPLTPLQEGILFHSLYESSSAYMVQFAFNIRGKLNIDYLKESFNELLKRHDILRTVFVYENVTQPLQVVLEEPDIAFTYIDLSENITLTRLMSSLVKLKTDDRNKRFNLSEDALMRICIIKTGKDIHQLIWTFHHILADGWCLRILISEFSKIYYKLSIGESIDLAPPSPYKNYIQWISKLDIDESEKYWRRYLNGLEIKTDLSKFKIEGNKNGLYKECNFQFFLTEQLTSALRQICNKHHVTMNTIFQVVWGIILGKLNYASDVVFGTVVSGRPAEIVGVDSIIGLFINTVPVRIRFDMDTKFIDLAMDVQQKAIESEQHHHFPFNRIKQILSKEGSYFDHLIGFQNYPRVSREDIVFSQFSDESNIVFDVSEVFDPTHYDLDVRAFLNDKLGIAFKFNENVYSKALFQDFEQYINKLFTLIANDENINIGDLKLSNEFIDMEATFPETDFCF